MASFRYVQARMVTLSVFVTNLLPKQQKKRSNNRIHTAMRVLGTVQELPVVQAEQEEGDRLQTQHLLCVLLLVATETENEITNKAVTNIQLIQYKAQPINWW